MPELQEMKFQTTLEEKTMEDTPIVENLNKYLSTKNMLTSWNKEIYVFLSYSEKNFQSIFFNQRTGEIAQFHYPFFSFEFSNLEPQYNLNEVILKSPKNLF